MSDHKVCAAVCYVERVDGKLLCVWNKRYGRWGWPGGKVEDGETPGLAAAREFREETGALARIEEVVFEGPHGESVESTRGSYVYVFRARVFSGRPHETEEGCAVTWLTREEFLKWGIAPTFYARMFAAIDAGQRSVGPAPEEKTR